MGERGLRGARTWAAAVAVAAGLLLVSAGAAETVLSHPISNDPYTNTNGDVQHKTQVEPDSFAFGNTIVAVTQSGRYVNGGGASNLVFSTSQNGRPDVDDRRPARNDGLGRRPVAEDQRPVDRL